jgi:hypothetical protein
MLCMNGRALNEKAIEVSPSSARVLDRAQDILQPFPPSKNRPRPGDWTCPSCGFSNFQRRTACFRCSYPAMGGAPQHQHDPNMGYGYGYGHNMMGNHMGGGGHGHHMGGHGHGSRAPQSSVPFRAGDWRCGSDGCGYHNFAKNVSCLRCGAPRATAAIVGEPQGYNNHMQNQSSYGMHSGDMGGNSQYGGGYGGGPSYQTQQYGAPQSTFALPSGMGAGASPYPPMGSHYTQSSGPQSAFDSRAESAFTSTAQTPVGQNGNNYGFEGASDPFSFLNTGMSSLGINDTDSNRRNGAVTNKSPS